MLRITTIDEAYADVEATLITLDGETLACWAEAAVEPVARYRLGQVRTVQAIEPFGSPTASARPRATPEFPNAFRRWTEADENAVIEAYHRGDTFEQIAAAVGRRVGGVRARLVAMNVIEPEPGDRLSYPGFHSPWVAAAGTGHEGDGLRPRLSVVRSGSVGDASSSARVARRDRDEGRAGVQSAEGTSATAGPPGAPDASSQDGDGLPEVRASSPGSAGHPRHPVSKPESGGPGEPPQTSAAPP